VVGTVAESGTDTTAGLALAACRGGGTWALLLPPDVSSAAAATTTVTSPIIAAASTTLVPRVGERTITLLPAFENLIPRTRSHSYCAQWVRNQG
jgi:hypothetical protein